MHQDKIRFEIILGGDCFSVTLILKSPTECEGNWKIDAVIERKVNETTTPEAKLTLLIRQRCSFENCNKKLKNGF